MFGSDNTSHLKSRHVCYMSQVNSSYDQLNVLVVTLVEDDRRVSHSPIPPQPAKVLFS